jgi:tetratricopeptide (TPR) repeat protein/mono/diheme cytochrome c family protein
MSAKAALALALLLSPVSAAQPLTFAHDIAPIIYQDCAPCHRPGEAGPFSLLSYADVKKRAAQIATVTRSGYMPPWLPQHGYGDFAGDRRLSPEQIRSIADWVAQGAPEGENPPAAPPFTEGWQMGTPDLVIDAPQPASVPDSGPDVYWNFIFTPNVPKTRYVRAIEIRPGNRRLVHHANLLIDRTGSARAREIAPGKGFPGMDVTILRSPFDPDGHFLFWKPGSAPHTEPDGFAWRLDPGNELVLNTHLHPSGKPEEVRPSIGLYFTGKPQTRFPLLIQLENDQALNIPPGAADFPVSEDFRLPMDVDLLAIYPHAHYLGKLLEAYATLPDGTRKWLIRVPHWDPNWQAVYDYREPVFLPKGAVISMRYHYDNSAANVRNPNQPPRRVRAGDQSADEMAHLWLRVLPRGPADRRRELQEAVMRHRLEKNPSDFDANFNLGAVMLSRLDAQGAVARLEAAVRIQPGRIDARNMLGLALVTTGRSAEAIAQYEIALKARPDLASARFNLANALVRSGNLEEGIRNYRMLKESDPNFAEVRGRLAQALSAHARQLQSQDHVAAAAAECREAIALDPAGAEAHAELGELLMLQGRFADALTELDKALELDPSNIEARDNREILRRR